MPSEFPIEAKKHFNSAAVAAVVLADVFDPNTNERLLEVTKEAARIFSFLKEDSAIATTDDNFDSNIFRTPNVGCDLKSVRGMLAGKERGGIVFCFHQMALELVEKFKHSKMSTEDFNNAVESLRSLGQIVFQNVLEIPEPTGRD